MFFKDRGWHPAGAIVASLATALGGSSIWRIQHIKQIETFAFFMLTLWLLARALERRTILSGVLAGLAAAVMIVEPGQVALIGCYVLIGYTLHYWLTQPRFWASVRQTFPALLSGGIIASLLAAGPILLSFLFILDSNRPDIPFKEAARGALHPASLLTAAIPDLYSVSSNLPYWGPASIWWPAEWLSLNENMGQVYIGVIPILLLLAIGVMRRKLWQPEIRFFSLAVAALLFYALGRYTIVFNWLYDYLPGVDMFRRPADATYALGPMTAIASGYFLHLIITRSEAPSKTQGYCGIGNPGGRVPNRRRCRGCARSSLRGDQAASHFGRAVHRRLARAPFLRAAFTALCRCCRCGLGSVHDRGPCHRQWTQPLNSDAARAI